jgi:hypothetical protein
VIAGIDTDEMLVADPREGRCDGHAASCLYGVEWSIESFQFTWDIPLGTVDGLEKSRFTDDFVKSSKFKARESRVTRRTYRTPQ